MWNRPSPIMIMTTGENMRTAVTSTGGVERHVQREARVPFLWLQGTCVCCTAGSLCTATTARSQYFLPAYLFPPLSALCHRPASAGLMALRAFTLTPVCSYNQPVARTVLPSPCGRSFLIPSCHNIIPFLLLVMFALDSWLAGLCNLLVITAYWLIPRTFLYKPPHLTGEVYLSRDWGLIL